MAKSLGSSRASAPQSAYAPPRILPPVVHTPHDILDRGSQRSCSSASVLTTIPPRRDAAPPRSLGAASAGFVFTNVRTTKTLRLPGRQILADSWKRAWGPSARIWRTRTPGAKRTLHLPYRTGTRGRDKSPAGLCNGAVLLGATDSSGAFRQNCRYYQPLRHPLACQPTSRYPVIRPTMLRRFLAGARRASPVAFARPCHRAVATTTPECRSASASLRCVILPWSLLRNLGLRGMNIRGHLCVRSRYGPVTRRPPFPVAMSVSFSSSVSPSLSLKLWGSGSFPGGSVSR